MFTKVEPSAELLSRAAGRGGCLSRAECLADGLTSTVIRRHLTTSWNRVGPGIYSIREPDWLTKAWAGLFAGGEGAVIGSLASAHLDGFADRPPGLITVWSPRDVRQSLQSVKFRQGSRAGHGLPPRSWPPETLLDAAWDCSRDEIVALVTSAFSNGRCLPRHVLTALGTRSRQAHRDLLVDLCTSMPGVESVLESHYVRDVARRHGLPEGLRQAHLDDNRLDCLLAGFGVIVELDGAKHHLARRFRDMQRDNANLVDHGLVTVRYGWYDVVARPCAVAHQLATLLAQRGWNGKLRRCRQCGRT